MHTNVTVLDRFGTTADVEFPELEVPILTGPQRQGDVFILPVTASHAGQPIGTAVTVVRAETNSSNTHTLHGDGAWEPNARAGTDLVQGWLTVPGGGEAFLIHSEEHNAVGIGAGTYEVRRQREYAGVWRQVAD